MVLEGKSHVDLDLIGIGDLVKVELVTNNFVKDLLKKSKKIGCIVISLKYGEFYFKENLSLNRERIIRTILKD